MARTSQYGMRGGKMHYGVDYFAPMGEGVHSVAPGTVTHATGNGDTPGFGDYGCTVVIRHESPIAWTLYAHLSDVAVVPGQKVTARQLIGNVGTTRGTYNRATGRAGPAFFRSSKPHVHFEAAAAPLPLHGGAGYLNPTTWLAAHSLAVPVRAETPVGPPAAVARALQAAARQSGVPFTVLAAVAHTESRYSPTAVSPAGALGLMQLMPATAAHLGVTNPFDPMQSALGGATFLHRMFTKYGNWAQALAAYNWGPGNVDKHRAQSEWPAATRAYVANVLARSVPELAASAVATATPIVKVSSSAVLPIVALGGAAAVAIALALSRRG